MRGKVRLHELHDDFADWRMTVAFDSENVQILCCPEDVHCEGDISHTPDTCCTKFVAPLCIECERSLYNKKPEIPQAGLTNDMMIFYAPRELYENNAAVMEMICASVCITSMGCFTLEK